MLGEYINFYLKQKILPWRQDLKDLEAHFQRRKSLYRHLGILPSFVRGRSVLELGPGSGHNSIFTASLEPSCLVLVEPHPEAILDIKNLFANFPNGGMKFEIVPSTLEEYESDQRFDFVFCESVLCGLPMPNKFLRKVADLVDVGGILVVTSMDDVSLFPDSLRRLFAQLLIDPDLSEEENLNWLTEVFEPQLSRLNGMTRSAKAWVLDNMINPTWDKHTLMEIIQTLSEEFVVFGTSPHFLVDWRWYKHLYGKNRQVNQRFVEQYWQNVHNFFDYRYVFPVRSRADNERLYQYCDSCRRLIRTFETDQRQLVLSEILELINKIYGEFVSFSAETAEAIREAHSLLANSKIDSKKLSASPSFGALFGRGLQYISLERTSGEY